MELLKKLQSNRLQIRTLFLIFFSLIFFLSCSVDMDSDLKKAVDEGNFSDETSDLPGVVNTGDSGNTTGDSGNTETKTGSSTTTGGNVYLYFSIPSNTTAISMKLEMAGDFDGSNEYINIYANGYTIGSYVNTGYQDSTLRTPSGWSSKTISSSYWTAGNSLTIKLDASSEVSGTYAGGQSYRVTLTYQ